jgi:hypothetical protein
MLFSTHYLKYVNMSTKIAMFSPSSLMFCRQLVLSFNISVVLLWWDIENIINTKAQWMPKWSIIDVYLFIGLIARYLMSWTTVSEVGDNFRHILTSFVYLYISCFIVWTQNVQVRLTNTREIAIISDDVRFQYTSVTRTRSGKRGTQMEREWKRVPNAFSVRLFLSSTVSIIALKGHCDENFYFLKRKCS